MDGVAYVADKFKKCITQVVYYYAILDPMLNRFIEYLYIAFYVNYVPQKICSKTTVSKYQTMTNSMAKCFSKNLTIHCSCGNSRKKS